MSIDVLDKRVGDTVPGELLASGLAEHRVGAKMGCRVNHWHCCLVPVNVVPLTERVDDVQLDVGEGSEGVEDETGEVLHPLDVLAHESDALPILHHVLVKIGLYGSRISVHVPQLVSAVNDKALTVEVLGSITVEAGVLPQAAVVVPGRQLNCSLPVGDRDREKRWEGI